MFALVVLLTAVTVVIELMVLWRLDVLLAAFKRHPAIAVGSSVLLSWLLGGLFGAAGLVVLSAALASTVITAVAYRSGVVILAKRIVRSVSERRVKGV